MSYIHPLSDVADSTIGSGSKIWQFVVILQGASIGRDCNICSHSLIEGDVVIGDRVTIKSGVQLWNGTRIYSDVFIGPNVTFSNDLFPRSKDYSKKPIGVTVKAHASIGANSTLLPGVTVGEWAMVGAGSVVTTDVPDQAVVVGNPARVIRYLNK